MAIVQISQITNRKGINSNLPQLAGAELGWSTDTRQLYIGNGTLQDGAEADGQGLEIGVAQSGCTGTCDVAPPTASICSFWKR